MTEGSSKPDTKKLKEKQQQKRKGKGGNQQPDRQQANKPDSLMKSLDTESSSSMPSKEEGVQKSSATNDPKLSAGTKETVQPSVPLSKEAAKSAPQRKSPGSETGSGDKLEKDVMSKKAGDVRKGIPSLETSPQNQSISREEPQTEGNLNSAPADSKVSVE